MNDSQQEKLITEKVARKRIVS